MTKSANKSVKHEGVKYLSNGKWAIKNYHQNVTGGASGRMLKHLMAMMDNGEKFIIINIYTNNELVYKAYMKEIGFFHRYFPNVHVEYHQHQIPVE